MLCTQQKKLTSLARDFNLPIFQLTKLLLVSRNMNYLRKNLIYLKQVYTSQCNQIKFENFKIFTNFEKIHCSCLHNLKSEEAKSQIKAHLSYIADSHFYNCKPSPRILRQHFVLRNLRKNEYIVITKPNKGN